MNYHSMTYDFLRQQTYFPYFPVFSLFISSSELSLTYFTIVVYEIPHRPPSVFTETYTVLGILYIYLDTSTFPTSFSEGRKWQKKVLPDFLLAEKKLIPLHVGPYITCFLLQFIELKLSYQIRPQGNHSNSAASCPLVSEPAFSEQHVWQLKDD